jgi:hypothetical protein
LRSDSFYGYGELESVRVLTDKMCAFVTYTTREATEKAAEATFGKLTIKNMPIRVSWGRPQAAMGGTRRTFPSFLFICLFIYLFIYFS